MKTAATDLLTARYLIAALEHQYKNDERSNKLLAAIKAAEYQRRVNYHLVQLQAAFDSGKQAGREEVEKEAMEQEPFGAALVHIEDEEAIAFYSPDMMPDATTLKSSLELVPLFRRPFPQQKPPTE